jgi:hypothetical protein
VNIVDTNLTSVEQILDGNLPDVPVTDLPDYLSGTTLTRWRRRRLLLTEAD